MTGQIIPARCNSHLCPDCAPLHRRTAKFAIEQGVMRRAIEHGRENVIFLTLTDTAAGALDLPGFRRQWDSTRKRLHRMWGASDYAMTVEFQGRGALHPHVFLEVDDQVADDLRDRRTRASYRRRLHELRPAAQSLGWGQMVDAVTVEAVGVSGLASYAAKRLSGYATKEAAELFKQVGAKNVRPVRLSYGWYEGGLARARAAVVGSSYMQQSRIEGKWERIESVPC